MNREEGISLVSMIYIYMMLYLVLHIKMFVYYSILHLKAAFSNKKCTL